MSQLHSSFFSRSSRPRRPYNWVQWTGIVLLWLSLALLLASIAADLGVAWLAPFRHADRVFFLPWLIGILLVSSRREPIDEATAETLARHRRLALLFMLAGSVLVAITLYLLKGA